MASQRARGLRDVLLVVLLLATSSGFAGVAASAPTDAGTTDPAALATILPPTDLLLLGPLSAVPAQAKSIGGSSGIVGKPLAFTKAAAARMAALIQAASEVAAASGAAAPAAMAPQFAAIVTQHNDLRCKHSAAALTWSDTLASQAAAYASQCIWGHDRSSNAGENLYATSAKDNPTAALTAAITAWYAEVNKYSYANPTFSAATGHFTQVVWRSSTQLGCAVQVCNSLRNAWSTGGTLVICRYSPAGNVYGQFQQNVLPAGSATDCSSGGGGSPGSGGGSPGSGGGSPGGGGGTPTVPTPTPIPAATIPAGYMIQGPGCLPSADGRFKFCVMDDASIVLFGPTNAPMWSSNTQGASAAKPFRLVMQRDGNLVAFDSQAVKVWASNTAGRGTGPGFRLVVQSDGNVVVFDALNIAIWSTNTCCQ